MTSRELTSWFVADLSTGTFTASFNDKMDIYKVSLRGYAGNGLNGTWPSVMKLSFRTTSGVYLGQSLQADATENPQIGMVVPIPDSSGAKWFQVPPATGDFYARSSRSLLITAYEVDGLTQLTATGLRLIFEVTHMREG